ncbi:MAG: AAA family ATPase [Ignisphaera sp.]
MQIHFVQGIRLMLSICNSVLDKVLLSRYRRILIYGEAGSGKTNIMLNILLCSSKSDSNFYYISTEGSAFLNRVVELEITSNNILFSVALDQNHLIQLIIDIITMYRHPQAIFIDSINHFYRIEAVEQQSLRMFLNMLTLLDLISYGNIYVITSAQIKADEQYGEVIAGYEYLSIWADAIVAIEKLSNRTRILRFVKPSTDLEFRFLITENGIRWLTGI